MAAAGYICSYCNYLDKRPLECGKCHRHLVYEDENNLFCPTCKIHEHGGICADCKRDLEFGHVKYFPL